MDGDRPWGLPLVACRNCRTRMPLNVAMVHMGAADLFACPSCSHQEAWRTAVEAVTHREQAGNWWERGRR